MKVCAGDIPIGEAIVSATVFLFFWLFSMARRGFCAVQAVERIWMDIC